ncbi:DUF2637 domain-containing protein [Micromonospora sp. CPCC 205371]|nr:DUF2637 domain-containing protein [Micromonospora sp. CPCC 205371]
MSAVTLPAAARTWRSEHWADTTAAVRGLKRIRWAVRATLLLGVAASVTANVLHAQPHLISQAIAAWPPVALLLTVELISRVPVHRKLLAAARLIATTTIAGIAAWVSYWHMVGVAARYGETGLSAYLLPVSVDGLVVVASISLLELSGQLRLRQFPRPAPSAPQRTRSSALPATEPPAAVSPASTPANAVPVGDTTVDHPPAADPADRASSDQPKQAAHHNPAVHDATAGEESSKAPSDPDSADEPHRDDGSDDDGGPGDDARQRRRRGTTRKAVIDAYHRDPTRHPTTIAKEVGTSERTVRRYLEQFRAGTGADSPNGANGAQHAHTSRPR